VADKPDLIEVHTRIGNDYQLWHHTAQTLFAAATILSREYERVRSTLPRSGSGRLPMELYTVWTTPMLLAFGVECLIKAIWVKQGHILARDGKYVPMCKNERHDLVRLCGVAGIALNPTEREALCRISRIAQSIGRYPVSRSAENRSQYTWGANDDRIIEALIARLKAELLKHVTRIQRR
jgi:hypothetical protein